jgi:hypothetical protein
MINQFQPDMPDTAERTQSAQAVNALLRQGGLFVDAVQRTRMPMAVADATLPGNPITFANPRLHSPKRLHLEGAARPES